MVCRIVTAREEELPVGLVSEGLEGEGDNDGPVCVGDRGYPEGHWEEREYLLGARQWVT